MAEEETVLRDYNSSLVRPHPKYGPFAHEKAGMHRQVGYRQVSAAWSQATALLSKPKSSLTRHAGKSLVGEHLQGIGKPREFVFQSKRTRRMTHQLLADTLYSEGVVGAEAVKHALRSRGHKRYVALHKPSLVETCRVARLA